MKSGPVKQMEKILEEYEKKGMRKSPFGPWKFRRKVTHYTKSGKI